MDVFVASVFGISITSALCVHVKKKVKYCLQAMRHIFIATSQHSLGDVVNNTLVTFTSHHLFLVPHLNLVDMGTKFKFSIAPSALHRIHDVRACILGYVNVCCKLPIRMGPS